MDWRSVGGLVGRSDWWVPCSILSFLSRVMHWNWACHTLALRFFLSRLRKFPILNRFSSKIFWEGELIKYFGTPANHYVFDALTCKLASLVELQIWHLTYTQLINSKITRVWYCDKFRLRPQRLGSKLSLSFTLSTPLESKRSTLSSAQLYLAGMKGSDKTDQDFKVGIFYEDWRNYADLGAQCTQPRKGQLWLHFFY